MARSFEPDPERDLVLDTSAMKALAHPLRMRLLSLLRAHGPATATQLAARVGVNTGATSYHLRQLASAGLVVEDEERGNARDRWWKAAHRRTYLQGSPGPDSAELEGAYLDAVAEVYASNMRQAVAELPTLPKAWDSAMTLSNYGLRLTATEAAALLEDLEAVIARYRAADSPDPAPRGARRVTLQLQEFVTPGGGS
ncbi:transcriptional regulator [Oryzihumus leptocrescens]|uniref:ArsR family transcriptional regulator n=1 Tax=Oryzihumus leptocrescens TaxID=297536 RepID=A0A542ZHC4_9MICO|nr:helix-turn-helix domain-containing protein [Oryzihumus leptocrescens]TQL59777.1 ArsR family transcriptional regulator [Oryzihumus leptocrescens]